MNHGATTRADRPAQCVVELAIGPVRLVASSVAILACAPVQGEQRSATPDAFDGAPRDHAILAQGARWLRAWELGATLPLPPIQPSGTHFQREVWEALLRVPYGTTCTYGEVARAIARPRAHRAVATAIAQNPVSILVPCHRVIGADGALRGFRWGIDTKARLISWEAGVARDGQG